MLTRTETRKAQGDAGRQAVQEVLSSPDLVALILERLPTPRLEFSDGPAGLGGGRDRWAASQVNAAFRGAALRLPWEARWGNHWHGDSAASVRALAVLKARNVRAWTVVLAPEYVPQHEQTNSNAAAVFNYARSTKELTLSTADCLFSGWLRHTLVPLPEVQGSPSQGPPVLACLASLSCLTKLSVDFPVETDASWVASIPQLEAVKLSVYRGPPLTGLPALKSLCLDSPGLNGPLELWASPRLTALTLHNSHLPLPLLFGGRPVHQPAASGSAGRAWLRGLQRLELAFHRVSPHTTGLRQHVPGLTYLKLCWVVQEQTDAIRLLTQGLPVGLRGLCLKASAPAMHPSVFFSSDLVSPEIWQANALAYGDVAALVNGLMRMPRLMQAFLRLPVSDRDEARVQEGCRSLHSLLLKRQGFLRTHISPGRCDF